MPDLSKHEGNGAMKAIERAPHCHMCRMLKKYTDNSQCTKCGSFLY